MQHDVEPGNNIIIDSSTSRMPNLALSVGKIFPSKANDLREGAVVGLDFRRDMMH